MKRLIGLLGLGLIFSLGSSAPANAMFALQSLIDSINIEHDRVTAEKAAKEAEAKIAVEAARIAEEERIASLEAIRVAEVERVSALDRAQTARLLQAQTE